MSRKVGKKTGKKTGTGKVVRSPRNGATMIAGAHPKNTGGKKGRSGRKPMLLHLALAMIRNDPKAQDALRKAASNPNSRGFSKSWDILTRYDALGPRGLHIDPPELPPPELQLVPDDDEVARALLVLMKAEKGATGANGGNGKRQKEILS